MYNPLVIPILEILKQAEQAVSEYELITRLQQQLDALPNRPHSHQLALFQTHFMVMNALYQLQQQLADESVYLHISPLQIFLQPVGGEPATTLAEVGVHESLRRYYLDWSNMEQTSEQDVEMLLNSFWQYYLAEDKQQQAYATLGLNTDADWACVQETYRRLVAAKHPDRGGDAAAFIAIREAYEVLLKTQSC